MSKTILHITDQLGIGGTETLLKNSIPLLKEYQHVICYLGGADELKPSFADYPMFCLEHQGKKDIFRTVKRLRKIVEEHKVDIIHAHLFWATLVARLAKPHGVRLLSTIHNVLSKDAFEKNKMSLWFEKATVNRQDALVAVSEYALADYLYHVRFKGTTHVLYNFIPEEFMTGSDVQGHFLLPPETLSCVAVGNLKSQKNYSYIIAAFANLEGLPVSLAVYGEGGERKQLQQAIDVGKMAIQLKGTQNNLQEILPGYDLFIQMSLYEGFGIALVEAMACGLVPVLSDIPVHREVAGDCAFYVNLDSPNHLSDTLKMVLGNKEEYLRRKEECRCRANEIAGKERYLERLKHIYSSLFQPI